MPGSLAERYGQHVTISGVRYESAGNRPKRDIFRCLSCGFEADADRVGAVNVLKRAGHARIACVFSAGPPRRGKQEPAEASAYH